MPQSSVRFVVTAATNNCHWIAFREYILFSIRIVANIKFLQNLTDAANALTSNFVRKRAFKSNALLTRSNAVS